MNREKNSMEKALTHSHRVILVYRFSMCFGLAAALALSAPTGKAQSPSEKSGVPAGKGPAQQQQVILITGSTDGLGRATALRLAATGAHIIVHGRNRERGMEVVNQIEREGKGSAKFYAADFASLDQVRKFAETILHDYDRLDVLINNAGISLATEDGRKLSADGYEMTFAVNYLSGFLLTRMLLPRLIDSAPSRIVEVSSNGQANATIDFDNIMLERGYDGQLAYRMSKLAQVMFTFDLARELKGTGVTAVALHPASRMPTHLVLSRGGEPLQTVEEGVQAVVHAATGPEVESGQYFVSLKLDRANPQAYDEQAREKLRNLSIKLTGLSH